jgi:hypothetical protein
MAAPLSLGVTWTPHLHPQHASGQTPYLFKAIHVPNSPVNGLSKGNELKLLAFILFLGSEAGWERLAIHADISALCH